MRNNQNVGAGRQSHTTTDGLYLERRYIYLEPSLWESLHFVSHKSGLSASQYLASILSAAKETLHKSLVCVNGVSPA